MIQDMWTVLVNRHDFFTGLLVEHLEISIIAIVVAIIVGGFVGILISEYESAVKPTLGVINFLYTIPSISMLGFLIPFSGVGNATAVIALTVYALLPMVRNTHTGISTIAPVMLEAAKGMGSTRMQILLKIKIPLAMPVIMTGIRNMVTMTIALAGIASFIGAGGLGVAIYRGITTNNAAMTMAGSVLIALLALLVDFLLGFVEKRLRIRNEKAKRANKIGAIAVLVIVSLMAIGSMWNSQPHDTIHIATKPMTEQYILGEMLDMVIEEETGLHVELTQGVGGGTSNIQPAMEKGEFDMYPEYTGTAWNMVLKESGAYQEDEFPALKKRYQSDYDMQWVGMYGFNNTYGIAVRRDIAEKYQLRTYSDLKRCANGLTFGAEYDFYQREDGYDALCKAYGFHFGHTMDMDIGLKYQALKQKQIDVMIIFTTDGQLEDPDIVVLDDDLHFFPSYRCGNVVRGDVLRKHAELKPVLEKLTGLISDRDMAKMNYQVETEGKEPRQVAREYLQSHGILQ
jgi:osmoprotectant transport system permease protein